MRGPGWTTAGVSVVDQQHGRESQVRQGINAEGI